MPRKKKQSGKFGLFSYARSNPEKTRRSSRRFKTQREAVNTAQSRMTKRTGWGVFKP